jgi:hypothetical protein
LALPASQPVGGRAEPHTKRTVLAGTWAFFGTLGYIAAVACGAALTLRLTGVDPSGSPGAAALTFLFAAGYCLAASPFAFVPLILLDIRRPTALADVLMTSVGLAARDFAPLLAGALVAGMTLGLPMWLGVALGNPLPFVLWIAAPWLTSGMLVHRYARLAPSLPIDPREGALPKAGVLLLSGWAALATAIAFALTPLGTGRGWVAWSGPRPGLSVIFGALALGWVAVCVVLVRAWTRARAARWVLGSDAEATASFSGELLLHDGAQLRATKRGIVVEGGAWVVGRDARLQLPPGVHATPNPLELSVSALAPGATITVVGAFQAIAQPGLRGASLAWPSGASLLVGGFEQAGATLARRATRWTIALLLPIMLLATVTAGALMLDTLSYESRRPGD